MNAQIHISMARDCVHWEYFERMGPAEQTSWELVCSGHFDVPDRPSRTPHDLARAVVDGIAVDLLDGRDRELPF